ncbi:MAG: hypothetical protein M1826_003436 [Phylliscum demangeonii]|nr:MAG: hypothetical protein M1826_003436 [Phylliscum demangeonii]
MEPQMAELKQRAAIEAAQDPNSRFGAEDAERKIVEETKKAGVPAYQFDPNASPEEKAAQARSHLPPNFHRPKQSKALGVVSDADTTGAVVDYDLPSSEKGVALAAVVPNGDAAPLGAPLPVDENARWVERAGWAPRFGSSEEPEQGAADPADHQTLIEKHLDEKFFGDWYHNAAVIVFACLSSWLVAVLGGGLGWLFIVMACCGTYYRTSVRRVRRNFRDDIEREMAKTRLETEVESIEWINNFLLKFWPIYQPVLAETIISSVDQVLSTATPSFLDSLRLRTFTLGSKPPRLDHVKTYPKAEDDLVLMDWKFSFTPHDTQDLTARQLKNKVNPKVVLEVRIGKGMVSKALDVIVENMAFSGLMRVKVKLQIPFPHVDRVEICFLEQPTIDYVCKPLGGDMLGFDINFVPGLETFIQSQIHANLRPLMYAPNVFPLEIAKMLAGTPVDQAIGVLAITIHGAQGLKNPDKFSGTPDPFVAVSLDRREALAKTKVVKENANPSWNETKHLVIASLHETLTFQVVDFNEFRKDKELGVASFSLEALEKEPVHENLQLDLLANGKARGILRADIRFFPVLEGVNLPDGTVDALPESNTGIVRFTVEQAKDLDGTKSLVGQLNPYAVLLLNGKEVHTSQKLKRTNNPIWANGSKELLITDRKSAKLGLAIKDNRDLSADVVLGTFQIKLDDLLQMMEKGQEWFNLAGAKTGRAKLMLQWKPVALTGHASSSGGYVTPIGVMRLHFQSARDLRNLETMGKSDPYVRVLLSGIEKARTVTFQSNLNPDWDEVHYIPMHSTREKLTFDVMDEETLGRDRSLGHVELSAADYIAQGENGEYLVHDSRRPLSEPLRMNGSGTPKGTLNFTASFYPCYDVADPDEEDKEAETASRPATAPPAALADEADHPTAAHAQMVPSIQVNGLRPNGVGSAGTIAALLPAETVKEKEKAAKLKLTSADLGQYESGLIVFKLIEGEFGHLNCRLEVVMDDSRFPSFTSSKARTRQMEFNELGDAFVRELDVSRIHLRLRSRQDDKKDDKDDKVVAKLVGDTLPTLRQCLYQTSVLTLRGVDGGTSSIKVSMKYLPVKMRLDPSESINNSGNVRIDVLDASSLPSADKNGSSDPYCKFVLNGKEVYKTSIQKKTLNPVWRESFEVPVRSRLAAQFKTLVYDWDAVGNDDFLGAADINLQLLEPMIAKEYQIALDGKSGVLRLRMLFRPEYVTRSRQGSSTFQGTMGASSRIVTGVAGAPIKGVGLVGGGVVKGASFLKSGFKGRKREEGGGAAAVIEGNEAPPDHDVVVTTSNPFESSTPPRLRTTSTAAAAAASDEVPDAMHVPKTPTTTSNHASMTSPHGRTASFGARSLQSVIGGGKGGAGGGPEMGVAHFTIVGASGYAPTAHVRVCIKQMTAKGGMKEVHKTKAIQAAASALAGGGELSLRWANESFRVQCTPDTQFLILAKDHASAFRNYDLGEAAFFIDDSPAGSEQRVQVGGGLVCLRTSFAPVAVPVVANGATAASPNGNANGSGSANGAGAARKSFLGRASKG